MEEVNKYLTEAMGEKYGGARRYYIEENPWKWFGKLWKWAIEQEWWERFLFNNSTVVDWDEIKIDLINPEAFAQAIYNYLKERE